MLKMKASPRCIAELKQLEGYTPVAKHLDGDRPEVITGGYGDTQVTLGETHTEPEWAARLLKRVAGFERIVNAAVKVALTQSQFDALVLLVYNIGPGDPYVFPPIDGLLTSTLLRKLNAGDYAGAAAEFPRWNKSNGKIQPGLVTRRRLEQTWFLEKAA
jgi:lysozyme